MSGYVNYGLRSRALPNFRRGRRSIVRIGYRKRKQLSRAAKRYLFALTNPFGPGTPGCAIPDAASQPTQKLTLRQRGIFKANALITTGANPIAYICFNPHQVTGATDATATYGAINYSSGVQPADHDLVVPSAGTGSNTEAFLDSPFTAVQAAANTFRVVAAGIRVEYASTFDSLKGNVIVFKHIGNDFTYFGTDRTKAEMLAQDEQCAFGALSHNTPYTCRYYTAGKGTDLDFGANGASRPGFMAIVIYDCTALDQFTFEVITHLEMTGPDATGTSGVPIDPSGMGIVSQLPKKQFLNASSQDIAGALMGMAMMKAKRTDVSGH